MKDIKDIMVEMESIAKNQVAVDLSEEEKEELKNLINTDFSAALKIDAQSDLSFCSTTPTPPPCNTTCPPQSFCCVVAIPIGLKVDPTQAHAAASPKCLSFVPGSTSTCTATIGGGCTLVLNTAQVNGCVEVFASLGVTDTQGNCTFICCSDTVCFSDQNIVCCTLPGNANNLKVVVSPPTANKVNVSTNQTCGQEVWTISGNITLTC